jgi:MFS family permease
MRGRVLALQAMVFLGSTPIGGPIVGFVTQHYGARYAIGVGAIACLGAGVWGLWLAKRNHIDELSDDVAPEQMAEAVDLVEDPPADGRLLPT